MVEKQNDAPHTKTTLGVNVGQCWLLEVHNHMNSENRSRLLLEIILRVISNEIVFIRR